jgi:hypothetical protein
MVDAGSVHVRRLDTTGKPAGAVLCTIAAGATECDATLTETGRGQVAVVVEATAKGSAIISPFFAVFSFDRDSFVNAAPHSQTIPVGVTQHAASDLIGTADVSWQGTVTLMSMP